MTWPQWSQSNQACRIHGADNCQECEEMHWNPQLVAQLEAERTKIPPVRRPLPVLQHTHPDSREEIEKRHQLAREIAHYNHRKKT